MKLLELFSGQGTISQTFTKHGFETYRVDWSHEVEAELHCDVASLTVQDIIKLCGGVPDVVWASPQCTTYSIATHRHRTKANGLQPMTDTAKYDDRVNWKLWQLIDDLVAAGTQIYFVENPRGRYRHMPFVEGRDRKTVTYCAYGRRGNYKGYENYFTVKPTDIFTNLGDKQFRAPCYRSHEGHIHSNLKYSAKRDYLSRGEIPEELREHIATLTKERIQES